MTTQLFLAPAASGKTAYVLGLVREAALGLRCMPRVLVPTVLQARAWHRRLADDGGTIGVQVLTFDRLYVECLRTSRQTYTELPDAVRHRLIGAIVGELPLTHYASLVGRPGFMGILDDLFGELKAARVWPDTFSGAVAALGNEARLRELALAYAAYQERLQGQAWADRPGLGWLAVEALEERAPKVGTNWQLLVVDGFDDFTPVQLALLRVLAGRVGELVITLTGEMDGPERALVYRRFEQARLQLEEALQVQPTPLPKGLSNHAAPLAHLGRCLFGAGGDRVDSDGTLQLIEAPDRATEARAALRWLKARLVQEGMQPGDVALLARNISPYRAFVLQTAVEYGLTVRLEDGIPLRSNPAVSAILDLLQLLLPGTDESGPALPRRLVIEAVRSPYFDWSALPDLEAQEPIGFEPGDGDALDAVARWGRVTGGLSQWEEILADLAARPAEKCEDAGAFPGQDEERGLPSTVPVGASAQALWDKFRRFLQRLSPPKGRHDAHQYVAWLEALIGADPEAGFSGRTSPEEPAALQVVACARQTLADSTSSATVERDVAALQAFKGVLRGLVWAEGALLAAPLEFAAFYGELTRAVEAASYRMPSQRGRQEILVANVIQARGVPFRAVAVMGLAEGEFPATLAEDAFLRDADRERLREEFELPLQSSTESAEAGFFYETVTRARERLLLTRPRLADNGAPWQASPFWEEARRLLRVEPQTLTSESLPSPAGAASWSELMESLAAAPCPSDVLDWVRQTKPDRVRAIGAAAGLFSLRQAGTAGSLYNGDLGALSSEFSRRFGPQLVWSPTRLESYRTCPHFFFVSSVLRLEPREEPVEGLDPRQLGNIYHRIFELLYSKVPDPSDLEQLLQALLEVGQGILDNAPRREGFRATAWWQQTCTTILEDVARSLVALSESQGDFVPHRFEAFFGLRGVSPLVVNDGNDSVRLRGLIDRVDVSPDGCVRVIDYKTAGPWAFTDRAVVEGKKLQLPLYALAARDVLGLGEPVDGFYWHVRHAEPSRFTMRGFEGGPEGAMTFAVAHTWEAVRSVRDGRFQPIPPNDGCPSYCPAAGFCWQYQPMYGS